MARNWSTFTRRITVKAAGRDIYCAWAVPSKIERWFLRSAEYVGAGGKAIDRNAEVKQGDAYLWRWHGFLDDVYERGTILEANGRDQFAFTFSEGSAVSVSILDEHREKVVELTQSKILDQVDREIYINCSYGWTFYLANLKSFLEGGVDLRNKDTEIHDVVNS